MRVAGARTAAPARTPSSGVALASARAATAVRGTGAAVSIVGAVLASGGESGVGAGVAAVLVS